MKNINKIKIIFDFDHTLFSAKKFYKATQDAFKKLGVEGKLFQKTFQKSKGEGRDYNPERQFKLIFEKEPKIKIKDLRKAFSNVLKDAPKFFYNDVSDFLKKWQKQADLILLSYGEEKFQGQKIEASKIGKYFKKIIITRDIEKLRPFKEIFTSNKKIIFVEDNPAALFRIKTIFPKVIAVRINREEGKYAKEKNPSNIDFSVKNLIELKEIIKQL